MMLDDRFKFWHVNKDDSNKSEHDELKEEIGKNNVIRLFPKCISLSKKDIYIFFHICCINNYIDVTNEMLDVIISSGLYKKSKKIFYSILCTIDPKLKERISLLKKFELIHFSNDIKEVEYPTLINLYNFCQNNDAYILYIHTKGVSLPKDDFRQHWRKRLVQKVIAEYKTCISFLNEGFDISGCGWKEQNRNKKMDYHQGDYEHFSGNFWWAKSDFIKKLPDIYNIRDKYIPIKDSDFLKYRIQCEFWVGMVKNIKIGVNGELNKEYSNTNFCESIQKSIPNIRVKKGVNGAAVIVETRNLLDISEVIKSHMRFLKDWQLIIFCSVSNRNQFYSLEKDGAIIYDDVIIESMQDYNNLLTNPDFWDRIPNEKVLIFQHDSKILRKGIEEFMEWDYVGAPWQFQESGGNGGFSLRTNSIMRTICSENPYKLDYGNEDIYFYNMMNDLNYGRLAPRKVCERFSVESIFDTGTFGCHAIEKYLTEEECEIVINQYNKK